MINEKIAKRILQECFWDSNLQVCDIQNIIHGDDVRKKNYLFAKILLNSTKLFASLSLFGREDLEKMIRDYKIPNFNNLFAKRRLSLTKSYFLNLPLQVEELKWKK